NYIFFALILWQILSFSYQKSGIGGFELEKPSLFLKIFACITVSLIFLQIVEGGAVSGLNAGLSYNTFPKMDGEWVPEEILLQPIEVWYNNIFEDVATAQFFHRFIAVMTIISLILFWILGHNSPHVAHLLPILFSIFVVEFLLGVLTLLFAVPITLTSLHQANVLLVFAISVTIMHRLFIPKKTIAYDIGYEESK
ncbi:MAG: COX15/CtaA family protein, partial [Pseudomonadota bacterium]